MSQEKRMPLRHWLSLCCLTCAAFIFNTSEFVPIGLLSDIQADFRLTEAATGMLISVYAWVVMLMSLPLMLLVSRMELRRLMLWVIGLFVVFQVMSFLSSGYAMLMASRIGVACTHAIFWSVVSPIAVRIVPDRFRSVALSMVVTGSSIAMILGMPLGRVIGLHVGWRVTFLSIGIFALLTFVYALCFLPKLPSRGGFSVKKLPTLLRNRALSGLFLFTLLVSTAYYVGYSYIEPFLAQITGMRDSQITATLMIFGGAGFLGSIAFSKFYNRGRKRFVTLVVLLLTLCLFLLRPAAFSIPLTMLVLGLWGLAATAYNVAMQSDVILITPPEGTSVAMSIFSGIFNLGIGLGAFGGGLICTHSTIAAIGLVGGAVGLAGLLYWQLRLGSRI